MQVKFIFCLAAASIAAFTSSPASAGDMFSLTGVNADGTIPVQSYRARQYYVRGDVGLGHNAVGGFTQADLTGNGGGFLSNSVGDDVIMGAGFGVALNDKFRLELTGEYRSGGQLRGMDNLTATLTNGVLQANTLYQGNLSSYTGMLNGYWDIFHRRGFTPYIGAGIGFAHNQVTGLVTQSSATLTDTGGSQTTALSAGTSQDQSNNKFAWALMAGTAYDLSSNAKLDLGYRYIDLGTGVAATSSLLNCACGSIGSPLRVNDLSAYEFRIGVRWLLDQPENAVHVPLK